MTDHDHKALRCRTGHHAWVETHLESGEAHRHSSRCGKDEYDLPTTSSDESDAVGRLGRSYGNYSAGG